MEKSFHIKYYIRTADEDRDITPSELKRIIKKNNAIDSFEIEESEDKLSDVDNTAFKKFKLEALNSKRLPDEKCSIKKR